MFLIEEGEDEEGETNGHELKFGKITKELKQEAGGEQA
jgi:hypothetical protein